MCWKLQLAQLDYSIKYRPGEENVAADTLTRLSCATKQEPVSLKLIHEQICHPGITRLFHYVKQKSFTYFIENVRKVC